MFVVTLYYYNVLYKFIIIDIVLFLQFIPLHFIQGRSEPDVIPEPVSGIVSFLVSFI